jgi:replicative DNA helicase
VYHKNGIDSLFISIARNNNTFDADSGALEKEADQVMMLYRDEVYNEESEAKGTAELILEKNRHGGIGKVLIQFNAPTVTFSDREAA